MLVNIDICFINSIISLAIHRDSFKIQVYVELVKKLPVVTIWKSNHYILVMKIHTTNLCTGLHAALSCKNFTVFNL